MTGELQLELHREITLLLPPPDLASTSYGGWEAQGARQSQWQECCPRSKFWAWEGGRAGRRYRSLQHLNYSTQYIQHLEIISSRKTIHARFIYKLYESRSKNKHTYGKPLVWTNCSILAPHHTKHLVCPGGRHQISSHPFPSFPNTYSAPTLSSSHATESEGPSYLSIHPHRLIQAWDIHLLWSISTEALSYIFFHDRRRCYVSQRLFILSWYPLTRCGQPSRGRKYHLYCTPLSEGSSTGG